MQTIPAAPNFVIETDDLRWRLLYVVDPVNQWDQPVTLVEADPAGLRYHTSYGKARRLPAWGIAPAQIDQVVVGWEGDTWQLGLTLIGVIAEDRGSRWCGITRWQAPDSAVYADAAHDAGRLLAGALGKPFHFVPPVSSASTPSTPASTPRLVTPSSGALPAARPRLQDATEHTPPITAGEWTLTPIPNGLSWERSATWKRDTLIRTIFFGVLTLAFALLSLGELRSAFAPVQPNWLPIAGLAVTVIMALQTAYRGLSLVMTSGVEYDNRHHMIKLIRRPTGVIKQIPFEKIEYVLISDMIMQRSPKQALASGQEVKLITESWIHLARQKGDFLQVAYIPQSEGRAAFIATDKPGDRQPLDIHEIDTPAHQSAAQIGQLLGIPVYVEQRA